MFRLSRDLCRDQPEHPHNSRFPVLEFPVSKFSRAGRVSSERIRMLWKNQPKNPNPHTTSGRFATGSAFPKRTHIFIASREALSRKKWQRCQNIGNDTNIRIGIVANHKKLSGSARGLTTKGLRLGVASFPDGAEWLTEPLITFIGRRQRAVLRVRAMGATEFIPTVSIYRICAGFPAPRSGKTGAMQRCPRGVFEDLRSWNARSANH